MGEFGWAYIECSGSGGGGQSTAAGPTGSLQFLHAGTAITGSDYLVFTTSSSPFMLDLTGTLNVSGTINAQEFNVDVHHRNVSNIDVSGSTKFGDTLNDTHQYSGSVFITGAVFFSYYRLTATSHTVGEADYIIGYSASAGTTITLPTAGAYPGRIIVVKDEFNFASGRPETPAAQIAISRSSSDKVDHGTFVGLSGDNASVTLYSDGGTNWFII
jgi:hypothetical protein